ncbi:hypothetical protein AHIS1636_33150 [Arthrobacter mangrovi]|uniref:Uncharacterized protein n=1 Tax=Arthrobacter mangrovi TaxID=2966350 RepID=A0ABQ5MY02_9MICC|nr:hypothetical protein AHIS1636_33150 [Arthrobacter mangrovi]
MGMTPTLTGVRFPLAPGDAAVSSPPEGLPPPHAVKARAAVIAKAAASFFIFLPLKVPTARVVLCATC